MKQFYCNSIKGICKKVACTNCKKYDGTGGKYIEGDKNPKTNFDRITESAESLAEFIEKITNTCKFDGCNKDCPLIETIDCKAHYIKEWLQKECKE